MRFWFRKYTVKCPDGTTRTVYHRIDDVFPLHLQHVKSTTSASVSGLEKIKLNLENQKDVRVAAVLTGIDDINKSIQSHFRAAYAVYEASPCTELPYLRQAVEKIIVDETRLRSVGTIISNVCGLINARGKSGADAELTAMVDRSITQAIDLLRPPSQLALAHEMAKVDNLTEEWKNHE